MIKKTLTLIVYAVLTVVGVNLLLYFITQLSLHTLRNVSLYVIGGITLILLTLTILTAGAYSEPPPISKFLRALFVSLVFLVIGFLVVFLFVVLDLWGFVIKNNLLVSFLLVALFMQSLIRKKTFDKISWQKISDNWLKWNGYSGLAIGGFGLVFSNKHLWDELLEIVTNSSYINLKLLVIIYIISILFFGIGFLVTSIGRTKSANIEDKDKDPVNWLIGSCILIGISSLGFYSLFIDSILLTISAYLSNN